jgi:hypothetical protein
MLSKRICISATLGTYKIEAIIHEITRNEKSLRVSAADAPYLKFCSLLGSVSKVLLYDITLNVERTLENLIVVQFQSLKCSTFLASRY